MYTFYQAVKETINAQVRAFIMMQGGELVLPTTKDRRLNLSLYGEDTEHEIIAIRSQYDNGVVCVESLADGEMHYDNLTDFTAEEMWRIIGLFLPNEE